VVLAVGMLRARTVAEIAQARNRWFTRTPGPTGSACWPTCTWPPA